MIGQTIHQYRLTAKLGEGGYGAVYAAQHAHLAARRVAVKLLHPQLCADEGFVAGLKREAETLLALKHPNIVELIDLVIEPGRCALVLELLEGDDLEALLARGPVAPALVERLITEALAGLAFAHGKGVLHRDLKPGNLFLCADGSVKLLDFGLAKAADSRSGTASGRLRGTLQYMAPERFRRQSLPQGDLYALGLVAWELLVGQRACPDGADEAGVIGWHLTEGPGELGALRPALPTGLCAEVMALCARDPAGRPADAAAALARWRSLGARSAVGTAAAARPAAPSTVTLGAPAAQPGAGGWGPTSGAPAGGARPNPPQTVVAPAVGGAPPSTPTGLGGAQGRVPPAAAAATPVDDLRAPVAAGLEQGEAVRERALAADEAQLRAAQEAQLRAAEAREAAARAEVAQAELRDAAAGSAGGGAEAASDDGLPADVPHEAAAKGGTPTAAVPKRRRRGCLSAVVGLALASATGLAAVSLWEEMAREEQARVRAEEFDLSVAMLSGELSEYLTQRVPAGTYRLGCTAGQGEQCAEDEQPAHQVRLSRQVEVGETEVTQALWAAVMGDRPSHFEDCGATCPVESVSWRDAVEFANKLSTRHGLPPCYIITGEDVSWPEGPACTGWRLPTEAEWEVAARGGADTRFAGGDDVDAVAWTDSNSGGTTHAVRRRQPNGYGLYDMSGNVWEWTWDWYGPYGKKQSRDPVGSASGSNRVIRGGSWSNPPQFARVAVRDYFSPGIRYSNLGVRLLRTAP